MSYQIIKLCRRDVEITVDGRYIAVVAFLHNAISTISGVGGGGPNGLSVGHFLQQFQIHFTL